MSIRISSILLLAISSALAQDPNAIFLNVPLESDRAAAEKGNVTANIRLGYRYLSGSAGSIDRAKASLYFSRVAAQSLAASAWHGYAMATARDSNGADGIKLIRRAADEKDPVAMTLLGQLQHHGKGVPQDKKSAKEAYQAAGNFAVAQRALGELSLESDNPADRSQALPSFLSAAAMGDTTSMVHLAAMYSRGDGVPQDYPKAAEWLSRAQNRGDPVATYQRGLMYQKGLGIQKSRALAASLFQRSALTGYPPAQAALGMCYAAGSGVKKDLDLAMLWLNAAAPKNAYAARQVANLRKVGAK